MIWGKGVGRRGVAIASAAVLVVIVGVGGLIGHRAYAAHRAAEAGCERVEAWKQGEGSHLVIPGGERTTAILGDSYSAGDDLGDRRDGWVFAFAQDTGDQVAVNSVGYTGYTAGGYCGDDQFATRVEQTLQDDPDRVIIQGGLNDVGADVDDISNAADSLIDQIDPATQIVLVGPPHAPQRADGEAEVDRALRAVAEDHDALYVSTYGWDLSFNEQGLHLTAEGHEQFAAGVAAALRP